MISLLGKIEAKIRNRNIGIVSFPKSGRTWLRAIMHDLAIKPDFDHETSNIFRHITYQQEKTLKPEIKHRKYIFLIREPKDVLISFYFQLSKRMDEYDGTLEEIIDHPEYGFHKICAFNEKWLRYFQNAQSKKHLFLTYEQLHEDTIKHTKDILKHFGFRFIDDQSIEKAVKNNTFKKLKAKEEAGHYKEDSGIGSALSPTDDPEGSKVRKGKVGGYEEYMTESQIKKCDDILKKYPLYAHFYTS